MTASSRRLLDLRKEGRRGGSEDCDETDDPERHPQAGPFPRTPPDHGHDPAPMNQQMNRQTGQEGHRDPEVDLPPIVAIESPDRRVATASGRKHVAEQHPRGREQHEGRECSRIDREVQGGSLHGDQPGSLSNAVVPGGSWTHGCLRQSYTETLGAGKPGSANAPTATPTDSS